MLGDLGSGEECRASLISILDSIFVARRVSEWLQLQPLPHRAILEYN